MREGGGVDRRGFEANRPTSLLLDFFRRGLDGRRHGRDVFRYTMSLLPEGDIYPAIHARREMSSVLGLAWEKRGKDDCRFGCSGWSCGHAGSCI